ncbi:MAG: DNA polymerase I [bacterium]
MPKRLFLIDAMAQIYRAHFAMARSPLFTSKGENVSAVFGVTNTLLALIDREKPDLLAVIYDSREPTFRHHIFTDYKATREKMPEELVEQLPRMDEVLNVLKIKKLILPGYEADDLVGTVAEQASLEGYEVFLVTGDKDYYQLVGDNVWFYNNTKGLDNVSIFGPEQVKEVFGVPPRQVIDVLALAGDSSDNVPGVPGIGPKKAIAFVTEYGSVEAVLNHADEIGGKTGENLKEFREQAMLSKDLVTIRTRAPIEFTFDEFTYGPWDGDEVRELFSELEFRSLFRYLDVEPHRTSDEPGKLDYKAVTTVNALTKLVRELKKAKRFAVDTETTSIDPVSAQLVGISVSLKPGEAKYIPVNHFQFEGEPAPPSDGRALAELDEAAKRIVEMMKPALEGGTGKIAQHAKYDFLILERYGVKVQPLEFDPMLADYLLNPAQRGHGLDQLAMNYLKLQKIETKELIGTGKGQITMDRVPLKQVTQYACEDADVTLRLADELEPRIENENLTDLLREVELPLEYVLMRMEARGIRLDTDFLAEMSIELRTRMDELEGECHKLAGEKFNLNSPSQLSTILFEKMNLPTKMSRKLKSGGWSTDQSVLERIAPLDPLPKKILEHRTFAKLAGTYVDALPQLVNPVTGRLHTSYHQTVASTGRLSSSDPNLQNIPIRTELGAEIRKAFIAERGHVLLSADYSQIELRMMAHLSGDNALISAFKRGDDIHAATAAEIFNVPIEMVSKEQRSASKAVNFGVLFGMREYGLSSRMDISLEKAREFIEGYFGAFPKVKRFIDELLESAHKDGVVRTILGRRRPMPELKQSNQNIVQQGERIAIATAVQGSAADLIKVAMIRLDRDIEKKQLPYRMLLQVHDELVFEVPRGEEEAASAFIKERMESAMELKVPLVADCGWGMNWLEAH